MMSAVHIGVNATAEIGIYQIAEEVCDRLNSPFMNAQDMLTRQQSTEELLAARVPLALDRSSYSVDLSTSTLTIAGDVAGAFGGSPLALTYPCLAATNPAAARSMAGPIVFADDFETPAVTRFPQGTIVHQTTANWSNLAGPGLQYWHNSPHQLRGITTPDGDQMVELDSTDNPGTGGIASPTLNSIISTPIDIAMPGRYELSFIYRSRSTRSNDNGIQAYWAADGDVLPGGSIITVDNNTTWSTYRVSIDVSTPGRYHLSLGAIGQPNFVGGLLDQVVLSMI